MIPTSFCNQQHENFFLTFISLISLFFILLFMWLDHLKQHSTFFALNDTPTSQKAICIFFLLFLLSIIHQLNLLSEYVGCYLPKIFITNQWRPKQHLIRLPLYFIWCLQSHITRDALIYQFTWPILFWLKYNQIIICGCLHG